MNDKMVSHSRQFLGCLQRILDYFDSNTLQLAYKVFVRVIMEYGNVAIMDTIVSHTQLSRLNTVQNIATGLPLQCRHHAATIEIFTVVNFYRCSVLSFLLQT